MDGLWSYNNSSLHKTTSASTTLWHHQEHCFLYRTMTSKKIKRQDETNISFKAGSISSLLEIDFPLIPYPSATLHNPDFEYRRNYIGAHGIVLAIVGPCPKKLLFRMMILTLV